MPTFPRNLLTLVFSASLLLQCDLVVAQDFGEMIRSSEPLTPEQELESFSVPEGFRVQLFAAEPDIQKPMNMAFDARGRLWVSGSNDYPFPDLSDAAGDSIRVLEDTDNDGRADKFTTFVDGITIPMGLYPYRDGVIAFTIPNITFYRDTNGDGRSDTSQVLYGPFDYSRDTHGLNNAFRRGLDGWLYACHGFNNHSTVAGSDGNQVVMHSGNTYRFRVDGTRIEHHTHGQVNPFGMTFDRWGDLYSSDCHTVPVSLLLKDGCYPSFGKPHDGLGFVPPVMTHLHGSTSIAGVSQYSGTSFPKEYRENLFVGNVMTSRIHRDVIEYDGSSVKVVERPDFLVSSDAWFRPVDIQCGPDEALYVADFYNRIIGHYEIPLDHPGRDRNRGRIWRITYEGTQNTQADREIEDLTQLGTAELIDSLSEANLKKSHLLVEELVRKSQRSDFPTLRTTLNNASTPQQRIYVMWVLHRVNQLTTQDLTSAFDNADSLTKVHVQRILADKSTWTTADRELAIRGLTSKPIVARAAAMAMASHPNPQQIQEIVELMPKVSENDTHLSHALKIALRNTLQLENAYDFISNKEWTAEVEDSLIQVSLAVKTKEAARFLLTKIEGRRFAKEQLQEIVTLAARHLESSEVIPLMQVVRNQFANEFHLQAEILLSILQGLQQKGSEPSEELRDWGKQVVAAIFFYETVGLQDWEFIDFDGQPPANWDLEPRSTADRNKEIPFLSSLPSGETATGILKSKNFTLPESLSFYICGHLGFPDKEPVPKNYVSLHLLNGDHPIKLQLAPRNDTAQPVTWDLSEFRGQRGYLQVTDGIQLGGYAWIAIAGIDPPVVRIPTVSPQVLDEQYRSAVSIMNRLGLREYESTCKKIATSPFYSIGLRFEALRFLTRLSEQPVSIGLLNLFREDLLTKDQRANVAEAIIHQDAEQTSEVLKTLPLSLQTVFARTLSNFVLGATTLHKFITAGTISPFVLQSPAIAAQIDDLNDEDLKRELHLLMRELPNASLQLDEMIQRRIANFADGSFNAERGQIVFEKNCAACHSLNGVGKKVAPQLDGIGNRGLHRLMEDILAPNRNIDLAFKSHTYLLENGKVLSGLFRRHEGESTVIADQKGEEINFPTEQIEVEKIAAISIMPENWGEIIPAPDFNNLVAYLLAQRQAANEVKE